MPLSIREVQELSVSELLEYVPQLRVLELGFFDASYLLQAHEDPDRYRDRGRINIIRSILLRERSRVVRADRPIQSGSVRLFAVDSEGSEIDLAPAIVNEGWRTVDSGNSWTLGGGEYPALERFMSGDIPRQHSIQSPLEGLELDVVGRKRRSWETAFLEEEIESTEVPALSNYEYNGVSVPEDSIANMGHTLREIAELLPPGILGVHLLKDEPYNLVFRPKNEDDPNKSLLLGHGWFIVQKCPAVLWAAPTLEAYNLLEESDMEFTPSPRARRWYAYTSPKWAGEMEFREDCPLFDFQRDAVTFMWGRKRAMLSLSPGLGKTLTAAYAAGRRHGLMHDVNKILLVCPASLLYYWSGELAKWSSILPHAPMTEIWHRETGTVPSVIPAGCQFWAITNPETLVKYRDEFEQGFDMMIVDESIMYKHRESSRSQVMNSVARSIDKVWLLTGAPATRYLDDMWHQFHILDNRGYSSYWRFAKEYCEVEETPWVKQVVANKRRAEREIKKNFADVYFARNQDQVANIPDWLFEDMDVPMKPKQEAVYQKLQKELLIKLEGMDDNEVLTVNNRLSLMLRSLQVASNPLLVGGVNSSGKWAVLPELMEIYPGPYILWINFIRTGEMMLDTLLDKFGPNSVQLANGSTSMEERNKMVDAFQAGKHKVIILNNMVGKFGFTLTKARTAFFLERDYNDSYFQCLHRNRRIGTTESPVIVNMRSVTRSGNRTVDHVVHDALDYRNAMIKRITVGDIRRVLEE